jgi:hypothetical protein
MKIYNDINFVNDDTFISFIYTNLNSKKEETKKEVIQENKNETGLAMLAPISREGFMVSYKKNGVSEKKETKDYSDVLDFKFLNSLLLYLMPQSSLVVTHS